MIGRIKRVPLREVWKHEALDLTCWLEQNIDVLNEQLGFELTNVEREKNVGDFAVDLTAEDTSGNLVIIENQLEKSNHDHLGKILTYVTNLEAKGAIWICSDPRPEHVRAISWLNESSAASFYLFKLEAVRIGESEAAPLLTLIVGPSAEAVDFGKTKKVIAERDLLRLRFWTQFLDYAKTRTKLHAAHSPTKFTWISAGAGRSGLGFNYYVTQHEAYSELYIDRGRESEAENAAIFNQLHASKQEIESVFGGPLEWQVMEGKRACRIRKTINAGGYQDLEERWPQIHAAMVDAMIRLEKALRPHIQKLAV